MLVHQRVLWMETQATPPRYGCCSFGCQHHQLLGHCRVAHRWWFLEPPKKVRSYWTSGNFMQLPPFQICCNFFECLILFIPNSWGGCQVTPTSSKPAARHCIGRRHWTSSGSCSRSSGRMSWAAWQRRGGWGLDGVGFARFGAVFSMNLFSRCCFLWQFHAIPWGWKMLDGQYLIVW